MLRHDEYGAETLLNLLLRNYLHYNLYDQVRARSFPRPGFLSGLLSCASAEGAHGTPGWAYQELECTTVQRVYMLLRHPWYVQFRRITGSCIARRRQLGLNERVI